MAKVNRKHLLEVLQAVQPGLARREMIEQSTCFIFSEGEVLTYNDEVCISHPIEELNEIEGAVQAKELYALLGKLTDEVVEVSIDAKSHLVVKGKKNKAGIRLEKKTSVEEILNVLGKMKDWESLPASFIPNLQLCLFSVGKDMTKAKLTCIHASGRHVMSGDGIRITVTDMGKKADIEALNIPAQAAQALKSFEVLEYTTTKGWAHFRTEDDVVFSCRVMEDEYPKDKTLSHVEKAGEGEAVKFPDGFADALERAGIFSAGTEIKTISDDRIRVTLEKNMMTVRGEGSVGWFEEQAEVKYKGKSIEFEVNPQFLHTILSHTNEVVINDNTLLFEAENFTHVILTLRPKGGREDDGEKAKNPRRDRKDA